MSEELMRLRVENQKLLAEVEVLREIAEMMEYLEDAGIAHCEAYDIGMVRFHASKKPITEPKKPDKDNLCSGKIS